MDPVARRPHDRTWWTAWLFLVGSALFALGALPFYADAVGPTTTAWTFFVGSIAFTVAAALSLVDADAARRAAPRARHRDVGWVAAAIQLAGTVWFNLSTGRALQTNLTAAAADHRIWRPDAFGSIAFLLSSWLAWTLVLHAGPAEHRRPADWWIGLLNLVGSVAFGVSAIAAYVVPATGDLRNAALSNLGTFAGALCFAAGAWLMRPARPAGSAASPGLSSAPGQSDPR